ncbi:hypothetical protein [Clostridium sp.]|uniref:hypothetical protein n=1 Tax=Clostridium sp. TaxID=1506 RepID=UPI001A64712C|nr:hypothetical protein [Clostridium sp.]MBK5243274.1 hypothetical protein [Clostridium sp.]
MDEAIKDIINVYSKCYLPKLWSSDKIAAVDGTMIDLQNARDSTCGHVPSDGSCGDLCEAS